MSNILLFYNYRRVFKNYFPKLFLKIITKHIYRFLGTWKLWKIYHFICYYSFKLYAKYSIIFLVARSYIEKLISCILSFTRAMQKGLFYILLWHEIYIYIYIYIWKNMKLCKYHVRIEISVFTDISVLRFYWYIGRNIGRYFFHKYR